MLGSLLVKVTGLQPASLLKSETAAQVVFCEFCKIFMNSFSTNETFQDLQCHIYLNVGIKSNLLKRTRKERISGVYSHPSQKSGMELFPKIVYDFKLFIVFKKSFILMFYRIKR